MIIILDTSSLLALVRYYLPFDGNGLLREFIADKIEKKEFLVIDKVVEEAQSISKGIILTEFPFIRSKETKTVDILPNTTFYNLLDNQFCDKNIKKLKGYTDVEYNLEKSDYLESADAKMILYAMGIRPSNPLIVTEETANSNDNKLFKKIPACCSLVNVNCCNIPILFKNHLNHNIGTFLK